jgi:hypothetical protein
MKRLAVLLAGMLAMMSAHAQYGIPGDVADYTFSGVVTSSSEPFATVGETITGTYVFNYTAIEAVESMGSPTGPLFEFFSSPGNNFYGDPPGYVQQSVFTATAHIGSVTLLDNTTPGEISSQVGGLPGCFGAQDSSGSSMEIEGRAGGCPNPSQAYNALGMPVLTAGDIGSGAVLGTAIQYSLTSLVNSPLKAVPEIGANGEAFGVALLGLLVGIGAMRRGRRIRSHLGAACCPMPPARPHRAPPTHRVCTTRGCSRPRPPSEPRLRIPW